MATARSEGLISRAEILMSEARAAMLEGKHGVAVELQYQAQELYDLAELEAAE